MRVQIVTEQSGQTARPVLFSHLLAQAVAAVPVNPKVGRLPDEKRPPSRAKIAAAWCHTLPLSGREIADVAGHYTGSPVNYSLLRNWRLEAGFKRLQAEATRQVSARLIAEFREAAKANDGQRLIAFGDDLPYYNDAIVIQVLRAAAKEKPAALLVLAQLAQRQEPTLLPRLRTLYRRILVQAAPALFAAARSEGDWPTADLLVQQLLRVAESTLAHQPNWRGRKP